MYSTFVMWPKRWNVCIISCRLSCGRASFSAVRSTVLVAPSDIAKSWRACVGVGFDFRSCPSDSSPNALFMDSGRYQTALDESTRTSLNSWWKN